MDKYIFMLVSISTGGVMWADAISALSLDSAWKEFLRVSLLYDDRFNKRFVGIAYILKLDRSRQSISFVIKDKDILKEIKKIKDSTTLRYRLKSSI